MYIDGALPPLPAKLFKKIEDGQFVKMAEFLQDHLISPHYTDKDQSTSTTVKYKEMLSIIEWLQYFSLYIAMIAHTNSSCVVDLLGYHNLIIESQSRCY